MATAGPNSGGTFADDDTVGTLVWNNPSRAAASDNSKSNVAWTSTGTSHYLKATNFGFGIPSEATIVGILVEIEKMTTADFPGTIDSGVYIVKGGSVTGDNKALGGAWATTDTYYEYGAVDDLWGTTWTPADINASDFGVVLSCSKATLWGNAQVDHIRITVYYTEPTAWTKDLSDTVSLSDSATKNAKPVKADTVTLSDARTQCVSKAFGDTVNLTDGFARIVAYVRGINDTITLSDVFDRVVAYIRTYTDNLTLADGIAKAPQKVMADVLTLADMLVSKIFTYNRTLEDTLTLSDVISKSSRVVATDTIDLTDARTNTIKMEYTDTLTLTDAQLRTFGLTLADIIILADVITLLNTIVDSTGTYSWTKHTDLVTESWGSTDPADTWTERTSTDKTWTDR